MNTEKLAEGIRNELRSKGYTFSEKERKANEKPSDETWMLTVHYSD